MRKKKESSQLLEMNAEITKKHARKIYVSIHKTQGLSFLFPFFFEKFVIIITKLTNIKRNIKKKIGEGLKEGESEVEF